MVRHPYIIVCGVNTNKCIMATNDTTPDGEEEQDEQADELPFRCMWEVGVNEAGDPDDWDHYHPLAKSEEEAEKKAQQEAREDGYTDPYPYMVEGPFKPDNPIRVGEEMIEEVFGDG